MVFLILGGAYAGHFWGKRLSERYDRAATEGKSSSPTGESAESVKQANEGMTIPLFFGVGNVNGVDLAAIEEEASRANESGIHNYLVPTSIFWPGTEAAPSSVLDVAEAVRRGDPDARFLLLLDLNPPLAWLTTNEDARADPDDASIGNASLCSPVWMEAVREGIAKIVAEVRNRKLNVVGYVPACLDGGQWKRADHRDHSANILSAYREWLKAKYGGEEELRKAWNDPSISFDTLSLPHTPVEQEGVAFFGNPLLNPAQVDFNRFCSEMTADVITAIVSSIKTNAGKDVMVFVPYGHTFEVINSQSGQLGFARLLETTVDGFISPISSVDRGIGGVGGFMGPIHSALDRGKKWLLLDDTRTGIVRDPVSGTATALSGVRIDDVEHVLKRNFAAALTNNLGIVWTDLEGKGAFLNDRLWALFRTLRDISVNLTSLDNTLRAFDAYYDPYSKDVINVVIDEESLFYQLTQSNQVRNLIAQARDAALVSGLPARFYLLSDVLGGRAKPASVYLFLNSYMLSENDRSVLHKILSENRATAVWLYAPGYIAEKPSVENIFATTGIRVAQLKTPSYSGSVCTFEANLLQKNQTFGDTLLWEPLFYIEDPDPNLSVLAAYRESGKPSVALKFMQDGWASVLVAEPTLDESILAEVLLIMEKPLIVHHERGMKSDVLYLGRHLLGIHGRDDKRRDRVIYLDRNYNVEDLLNPKVGWPNRSEIDISLALGETRLFRFHPVQTERLELKEPNFLP